MKTTELPAYITLGVTVIQTEAKLLSNKEFTVEHAPELLDKLNNLVHTITELSRDLNDLIKTKENIHD